jgi:hypothetical protein
LVAVSAIGLLVPDAGNPMAGLLFVHDHEVTFVPESGMEKIVPLQYTLSETAATTGIGLVMTCPASVKLRQPLLLKIARR